MALVEASAPTLPLETACYYGGWASLSNVGKQDRGASFSLCPPCQPRHSHEDICMRYTYDVHTWNHPQLQGTGRYTLPNNKKATRFQSIFQKSYQQDLAITKGHYKVTSHAGSWRWQGKDGQRTWREEICGGEGSPKQSG